MIPDDRNMVSRLYLRNAFDETGGREKFRFSRMNEDKKTAITSEGKLRAKNSPNHSKQM